MVYFLFPFCICERCCTNTFFIYSIVLTSRMWWLEGIWCQMVVMMILTAGSSSLYDLLACGNQHQGALLPSTVLVPCPWRHCNTKTNNNLLKQILTSSYSIYRLKVPQPWWPTAKCLDFKVCFVPDLHNTAHVHCMCRNLSQHKLITMQSTR